MTEYDAVIVGTGPAGAATAITLARAGRRVLGLEKRVAPRFNVGETLPPAAIALVEHFIGPAGQALRECSVKAQGNISVWGSDTPEIHDFFFSPNGSGLCVNRCGFDAAFRDAACAGGAVLVQGAIVGACHRDTETGLWTIGIETEQGAEDVHCKYLIDASGRHASIGRLLGIDRKRSDGLFSYALRFVSNTGTERDAYTRIEACPYGWWYSNRLPATGDEASERVVVLHTDKGLSQARLAATRAGFLGLLSDSVLMHEHLQKHGYNPVGKVQGAPAGSECAAEYHRDGFLAVGDAAQAFDPLSSQGIWQALQSASVAGQMVNYALANADIPGATGTVQSAYLERYARAQGQCWARYQKEYGHFYSMEDRWADHPFWDRRRSANSNFQSKAARETL